MMNAEHPARSRPGGVRNLPLRSPFGYFFTSRLHTKRLKVGWLLGYVFPLFALAVASEQSARAVLPAALMLVAVYAAYGYGYLVNDAVVAEHEARPTQRLRADERAFVRQHLSNVFGWRALIGVVCVGGLLVLQGNHAWPAAIGWCLLWPVFAAYNHWRGRATMGLYFVLVSLRFVLPILAANTAATWTTGWPLLLLYALPTAIEAMCKRRYALTRLQTFVGNVHHFRMRWFALLSVVAVTYAVWASTHGAWLFVAAAFYYFLFRVGAWWLQRRSAKNSSDHQRSDNITVSHDRRKLRR